MSKNNIANDLILVLNGILKVARSGAAIQRANTQTILQNSNLKKVVENVPAQLNNAIRTTDFANLAERVSMLPVGIRELAKVAPKYIYPEKLVKPSASQKASDQYGSVSPVGEEEILNIREEDLEELYIQSLGVEVLQQNVDGKRFSDGIKNTTATSRFSPQSEPKKDSNNKPKQDSKSEVPSQRTDHLFIDPVVNNFPKPDFLQSSVVGTINPISFSFGDTNLKSQKTTIKPLSKNKPTSQLSSTSKQRKVPATRISRLVSYGSLAAGLGIGALTEMTKRSLGLTNSNQKGSLLESSPFLTEANAERIVDTLCRVRGAALKIGQILSIQDNSMISPQLQKVFERVRHAADFMPDWQMEKMLLAELGTDWHSKLLDFDPKPFAAASIGQVHLSKLEDGRPIAIKIQYPGVGQGINSDIDNLISVLNVGNIIPEGIFMDNIIKVAKRELLWEVDYLREAQCAKRFRKLLEPYPDYYVPDVIDRLTTKQVYATELIEGLPVDKCENLDQDTRNRICFLMLDLFFRELFEFQFMQTDPNWANFLYNTETKQIGLLDFGSSREYKNSFVDNYMRILQGAAGGDREIIMKYSRDIGFLSGYESKIMENAHTETVLLLGEALRMGEKPYDFGSQDLTRRIQRLVPIMVKERLCPPPEEIYSLHRKLSGIFLLCSKLQGKVHCRQIFERVTKNYQFGRPDTQSDINLSVRN